jgi:hypothetical protein
MARCAITKPATLRRLARLTSRPVVRASTGGMLGHDIEVWHLDGSIAVVTVCAAWRDPHVEHRERAGGSDGVSPRRHRDAVLAGRREALVTGLERCA